MMLSQALLKLPHLPPQIASLQALNVALRASPGAAAATLLNQVADCPTAGMVADPQTPPRFATDPDRLSYSPASSHFLSPRHGTTPFVQDYQGRDYAGTASPKRGSPFVHEAGGLSQQQQYLRSPKRLSMSPFAMPGEGVSAAQPHFVSSARRLNFYGCEQVAAGAGLETMSSLGNEMVPPFATEFDRLGAIGSSSSCQFVSDLDRLSSFMNDAASSGAFSAELERLSPLGMVADLPSSSQYMSDSERLSTLVGNSSNPFVGDSEGLSAFVNDPESLSPFVGDPQVSGRFECDPSQFVSDGPCSSQMASDSERFSEAPSCSHLVSEPDPGAAACLQRDQLNPWEPGDARQTHNRSGSSCDRDAGRLPSDPARLASGTQACCSRDGRGGTGKRLGRAVTVKMQQDHSEQGGMKRNELLLQQQAAVPGDHAQVSGDGQSSSPFPGADTPAGGGFRPSDRHSGSNCDVVRTSEERHIHVDSLESSGDEHERAEAGVELINLLLSCTQAVASGSLNLVNQLLAQLGELASPEGSSVQRVVAYFTEGLALRIAETWPQLYQPLPCHLDPSEEELLAAFHILNHVCPYTKFSHFTANEAILQVFEGQDRVHVIDFDIQQGLQWPALFQSLATRPQGPPHLRITGVGECKEDIQDTGDRLAEFAEDFNLPFEFHPVVDTLEELRLWMLHVKEKETVAVNCVSHLHRALHDDGAAVRDVLDVIKSTKPKVLVVVEQEASHNGPFEARILEALQYYSAIFDSIDASLPLQSEARLKLERLFAKEIRNIVACEGLDRTERHVKLERWRDIFGAAGFEPAPLSHRAVSQAKLLLYMFTNKGYRLEEDKGALILNWLDRPLFSVSSWTVKQPELTTTG